MASLQPRVTRIGRILARAAVVIIPIAAVLVLSLASTLAVTAVAAGATPSTPATSATAATTITQHGMLLHLQGRSQQPQELRQSHPNTGQIYSTDEMAFITQTYTSPPVSVTNTVMLISACVNGLIIIAYALSRRSYAPDYLLNMSVIIGTFLISLGKTIWGFALFGIFRSLSASPSSAFPQALVHIVCQLDGFFIQSSSTGIQAAIWLMTHYQYRVLILKSHMGRSAILAAIGACWGFAIANACLPFLINLLTGDLWHSGNDVMDMYTFRPSGLYCFIDFSSAKPGTRWMTAVNLFFYIAIPAGMAFSNYLVLKKLRMIRRRFDRFLLRKSGSRVAPGGRGSAASARNAKQPMDFNAYDAPDADDDGNGYGAVGVVNTVGSSTIGGGAPTATDFAPEDDDMVIRTDISESISSNTDHDRSFNMARSDRDHDDNIEEGSIRDAEPMPPGGPHSFDGNARRKSLGTGSGSGVGTSSTGARSDRPALPIMTELTAMQDDVSSSGSESGNVSGNGNSNNQSYQGLVTLPMRRMSLNGGRGSPSKQIVSTALVAPTSPLSLPSNSSTAPERAAGGQTADQPVYSSTARQPSGTLPQTHSRRTSLLIDSKGILPSVQPQHVEESQYRQSHQPTQAKPNRISRDQHAVKHTSSLKRDMTLTRMHRALFYRIFALSSFMTVACGLYSTQVIYEIAARESSSLEFDVIAMIVVVLQYFSNPFILLAIDRRLRQSIFDLFSTDEGRVIERIVSIHNDVRASFSRRSTIASHGGGASASATANGDSGAEPVSPSSGDRQLTPRTYVPPSPTVSHGQSRPDSMKPRTR
ncbi:hypothetical protein BC831DRAFT_458492 [Entophlyctis helioformis]|nr:hypothetical protein BC831DRAFT_458492 [Entophlyctis helioformis]